MAYVTDLSVTGGDVRHFLMNVFLHILVRSSGINQQCMIGVPHPLHID